VGFVEQSDDGLRRPREHQPLLRVGIAFLLAMPLLAYSLIRKFPDLQDLAPLDVLAFSICAAAVAWNAIEYALGKAAFGQETPPWLRWALAVPYFLVTWVGVGSLSWKIARLAFVVGELGYSTLP